jgi:hypothetical protein
MKRSYLLLFAIYPVLIVLLLWACGGGSGSGSPGSCGTEDTGVMLDPQITEGSRNVDAWADEISPGVYCGLTDSTVTLTVNSRLINPTTEVTPGVLYVEKYTIEYRRSQDSIGAPPIENFTGYHTIVMIPPAGEEIKTYVTTGIILVDLVRKLQYANDIASPQYTSSETLNNYTAIYTFEGKNQYGADFCFKVQFNFEIGNYANCGQ